MFIVRVYVWNTLSRFGDEQGISTKTFMASLAYVVFKDPKSFILEMV
jgi:hypothetical protein